MMNMTDSYEDIFLDGSDFDDSSDFWSTTLTIARPSKMSDELMQIYFKNRDGRWSRSTKQAIIRHKAIGLDLNENWSLMSTYWSCPSCRRSKSEIFRRSTKGILLAKLELHHDHIVDSVSLRADKLLGANWRETAIAGSGYIIESTRSLAERFHTSLICSECNSAEGSVKLRFRDQISENFSFTAREISEFIQPSPHSKHKIAYEKALEIWKKAEDSFEARTQIIDHLILELGRGNLMKEPLGKSPASLMWQNWNSSELLVNAFREKEKNSEKYIFLENFRAEFLARSTSMDSATLNQKNSPKTVASPSDEDFAQYIDPVSTKRWQVTPSDWECPVCQRTKRQILRTSNKGKWSGGVREHREYIDEENLADIENRRRIFPQFRNDFWIKGTEVIHICSDCASISTEVAQRDRSLKDPHLKLQDLRDCILSSGPNQKHTINTDLARQLIEKNEPYSSARAAFERYTALISRFHTRMEYCQKIGLTHSECISEMCEELHFSYGISDISEQEELVHWLIRHS